MTTRRKKHLRARRRRLRVFADSWEPQGELAPYYAERGLDPVHPLADETELLGLLGLDPEECDRFDAYWRVDDDVVFLQVASQENPPLDDAPSRPGLYARRKWDDGQTTLLALHPDAAPLTRARLDAVLDRLIEVAPGPGRFRSLYLGKGFRRLADWPAMPDPTRSDGPAEGAGAGARSAREPGAEPTTASEERPAERAAPERLAEPTAAEG
ncbi:MAG: hypothetical protein ACFCGT_23780 [Sandaracinaceae bacterium]